MRQLNGREQEILRSIVSLYILKANPVGSRPLSKFLQGQLNLSPASIRNVMSDLEDMDYRSHPHTSAGRVPTDKGYRFYVDNLMKAKANQNIESESEIENALLNFSSMKEDSEEILKEASRVLGTLSKYLAVVRIPQFSDLFVQKIELIPISSNKVLTVIALESNIVRTVTLESDFQIETKYLQKINSFINEKVSGRSLRFIKDNFINLISDINIEGTPIVRLFIDSLDKIFLNPKSEKLVTAGTQNLLQHPEFEDITKVKSIIELVENENIIIHLLDNLEVVNNNLQVLIGAEMENNILDDYSVVVSSYRIGSASGSIGLIGPKRMNYPKMMGIVSKVADILSK